MNYSELVDRKIQQIREFSGLELDLYSLNFKKKKGFVVFDVNMATTFQNMELYKLDRLVQVGIISKSETAGYNRVSIYFVS
jgi:hypothetical protein